jgi:hypothetical protein
VSNAFEEPRLAQIYDLLYPDRSDLDMYVALAEGFGARSVLDLGCGTGTFRERGQVAESLMRAGFTVEDLLDASDRPGQEMVFFAKRRS